MLLKTRQKAFTLSWSLLLCVFLVADCRATPILTNIQSINSRAKPGLRQPLPISSTEKERIVGGPLQETSTTTKQDKLPLIGGTTLFVLPFRQNELPGSWCKSRKYRQKIHHIGCKPVYIMNNMCFGQCLSFFIPKHFQSCSSCQPKETIVKPVQLQCNGRTKPLVKNITIVKSCQCQPCERSTKVL